MSTQVQYRYGSNTDNNAFTGALAEITVDTTNNTLRVHNGITVGGFPLIGADATQTLANKTYQGVSVSVTGNVTGAYLFGNASTVTGLSASKIFNGTSEANIGTSGGNANISIGGTSNVAVFTTAGVTIKGNIENGGSNGVGNIGSSTGYFNTVFAQATSAQYADLAEMYCADAVYVPGTVLEFGGSEEVTATTQSHSTRVAGIVSTNPSYLMNSALDCKYAVEVALTGRVPCQVVGTIRKGDRLVAGNLPGVATVLDMKYYEPGCIIGKALENYDSIATGVIEVAVGRY